MKWKENVFQEDEETKTGITDEKEKEESQPQISYSVLNVQPVRKAAVIPAHIFLWLVDWNKTQAHPQ